MYALQRRSCAEHVRLRTKLQGGAPNQALIVASVSIGCCFPDRFPKVSSHFVTPEVLVETWENGEIISNIMEDSVMIDKSKFNPQNSCNVARCQTVHHGMKGASENHCQKTATAGLACSCHLFFALRNNSDLVSGAELVG